MALTNYRKNILDALITLFHDLKPDGRALDFGCGDGFFFTEVTKRNFFDEVLPYDVVKRENSLVEPRIYDGERLPLDSQSIENSYCIDVLHHCPIPENSIRELCRVTKKYIFIKDHTYKNSIGKNLLYIMDEIGNKRFNIASPANYQRLWEWDEIFIESGFERKLKIHPHPSHTGTLGFATNKYQYIDVWERKH